MKVFNISDQPTPGLRQKGMYNTPVRVGSVVVLPGKSVTVKGTAKERADAFAYRRQGVLAIDRVPEGYKPLADAESTVVTATMPAPPPSVSSPPPVAVPVEKVSTTGPTMLPEVPSGATPLPEGMEVVVEEVPTEESPIAESTLASTAEDIVATDASSPKKKTKARRRRRK